jgi:tetratricopeptide (TPR) repeat protein
VSPDATHPLGRPTAAWQRWAPPVAVVLATLIVFGQSISFEFVADDWIVILNNPHINPPTLESFGYYWTHIAWNLYMPVTCMVWAGLARFAQLSQADPSGFSLNPYVFHFASVTLHIATALAVYRLLRRVIDRPWPAAAGAVLFAAHPLQAEAVCCVGVINNSLFGLCSILAVSDYLEAVQPATASRRRMFIYIRGILLMVLALLSKPTAVVTPLIAAILDWAVYHRSPRAIARSIAPWFAIVIPMALITKLAQPATAVAGAVPLAFRPLVAGYAIAFYAKQVLLPLQLAVDYGRNPAWLFAHPSTALAYSAATIALLVIAWQARRRAPLLSAGILIFIASLLPNAGLVASDIQQWSTVADRYIYAAMLGPALLLAWALSRPVARSHALPVIVLMVSALGAFMAKAAAQAWYWHDDARLCSYGVRANPASWIGHDHLSFGLLRIDPPRALAEAKIAHRLRPNAADPHRTLAAAYLANGERAGAFEQYRIILRYEPDDAIIMTNLAAELAELGRPDEAIPLYQSALRLSPDMDAARRGLALAEAARNPLPPTPPR